VKLGRVEERRMLFLHKYGVLSEVVVACDVSFPIQKEGVVIAKAIVLVFSHKLFNDFLLKI
jgi:small basic protein